MPVTHSTAKPENVQKKISTNIAVGKGGKLLATWIIDDAANINDII